MLNYKFHAACAPITLTYRTEREIDGDRWHEVCQIIKVLLYIVMRGKYLFIPLTVDNWLVFIGYIGMRENRLDKKCKGYHLAITYLHNYTSRNISRTD
jgi:hypothetical protein